MYCVLTIGLAVGLAIAVLFSPPAGDHAYAFIPEALSCTDDPLHIIVSFDATTFGLSMLIIMESFIIVTEANEMLSRAKSFPCTCVFLLTIAISAAVLFPEFHVV